MFKTDAVALDKQKVFVPFFIFIVCGFALLIFTAKLYPQFIDLIGALTSVSSASISGSSILFYSFGWIVALMVGILWLFSFLAFEMAKEDLIALMRNQK